MLGFIGDIFEGVGSLVGGILGLEKPPLPPLPPPPKLAEIQMPKPPDISSEARRRARRARGMNQGFASTIQAGFSPVTGALGSSAADRAARSIRSTLG